MMPPKIHYCWFGRKPLPPSALNCIASWEKFFPDYEIIEWNEDNYDINKIPYIKQAYAAKKYAFVSDYARFDILYHEGGIYFDTDVEVIKPFDDILDNGAFMGCEIDPSDAKGIMVNPGLGMGACAGDKLYKEILDYYAVQSFLQEDGSHNLETVVTRTTKILTQHGLKKQADIQVVDGIVVYPREYFNPLNNNTGVLHKTEKTHSIHWYTMSWLSSKQQLKSKITRPLHRIWGEDFTQKIKKGLLK